MSLPLLSSVVLGYRHFLTCEKENGRVAILKASIRELLKTHILYILKNIHLIKEIMYVKTPRNIFNILCIVERQNKTIRDNISSRAVGMKIVFITNARKAAEERDS